MANKINNGGPAFARAMGSSVGRYSPSQDGMSLRDWFATHAPPEIPTWFRYAHPTSCPILPMPPADWTADQRSQWEGLGEWLSDEDVCEEVLAFRTSYEAAYDAMKAWQLECDTSIFIAWRWRYADLMIAARGEA